MPKRKTLTKKKRQRGGADGNINSILKSVTNAQTSGEKKPANTSTTMASSTNMKPLESISQTPTLAAFTPGENISKPKNSSTNTSTLKMSANVKPVASMDFSKLSNSPKTNAANTSKKDAFIKKMNAFKNNLETMRKDFESLMTDTSSI